MLTETPKGALWGKLGASAKTIVMGTAGLALWGSLAFYLVVDTDPKDIDALQSHERLFLRMELPETALLDGCVENFGGPSCNGNAWIIISENGDQPAVSPVPRMLRDSMPEPLWNQVVARHAMTDAECKETLVEELPDWLTSGARKAQGLHATLLPDRFTSCQGISSDIDPLRQVQAFWIMNDEKVVAEVRCTMPGGNMDSECQLSAYPENGTYVVSYSRLPATNIDQIMAKSPDMLAVLANNLPESMADRVDLGFMNGRIVLDDATAHAVASLNEMVR